MARRFNSGYYISEGLRGVVSHGFMSFAAVCMIVACLLIMGTFSLLAVNLEHMLGDLERENVFLAYIDEDYTPEQAQGLQSRLLAVPNVASAEFVSRQQAMADYRQGREDIELLAGLPDDVLRDRYRIHVSDIERLPQTVASVKQMEGIVNISAEEEVARGFVMVRNIATGVAVVLIGILLVISLFIIANTIKLATFNRREEIAIMKMCGGTNGFIRWPFVVEGMVLGLTGALLAFFLQWGIYQLICSMILQPSGLSLVVVIPYRDLAPRILAIFSGTGFVIGVGGSTLAIRKFLQV